MKIDAHHHFWNYSEAEYGWIDDSMKTIRRDFLPEDLHKEISHAGIDGVLSVQARTTLEETRWLLQFADRYDWIFGVVGWVPLLDPDVERDLVEFSKSPKFKSVRHILQAEPDSFFENRAFNSGIEKLRSFGLTYDLLITENQLPAARDLVDRHSSQTIVLDHIAKPKIKANTVHGFVSPFWKKEIRELARRPHVFCKISGMVTEADFQCWSVDQLTPYFEVVLEAFGADRLLFGSDWPVCQVACDYGKWARIVEGWISKLSSSEQEKIRGLNAVRAYRLNKF